MNKRLKTALGCAVISQTLHVTIGMEWTAIALSAIATGLFLIDHFNGDNDSVMVTIASARTGFAKIEIVEHSFLSGTSKHSEFVGKGDAWLSSDASAIPARKAKRLEQLRREEIVFQKRVRAVAREVGQTIELMDVLDTWLGGGMPVPEGTPVVVRLRSGHLKSGLAGSGFASRWSHTGEKDDIVAFRVAKRRRQ